MASVVNPQRQQTEIRRILVFFASADLQARKAAELRFEEQAMNVGLVAKFIPAYMVFFPGQQYTQERVAVLLREHGIDAVLVAMQGQSGTTATALPTTAQTRCTLWTSAQGCLQTGTTVTGGVVTKPWASYTVMLVDTTFAHAFWIATASSRGNAFASWGDLRNSLVSKTIDQLIRDGVLRKRR